MRAFIISNPCWIALIALRAWLACACLCICELYTVEHQFHSRFSRFFLCFWRLFLSISLVVRFWYSHSYFSNVFIFWFFSRKNFVCVVQQWRWKQKDFFFFLSLTWTEISYSLLNIIFLFNFFNFFTFSSVFIK